MKEINIFIVIMVLIVHGVFSQTITISGFVRDALTQEVVVGARVYFPELKKGAISNTSGYYSVILQEADSSSTMTVNFVGYETWKTTISLTTSTVFQVNLNIKTTNEVEIIGKDPMRMPTPDIGLIQIPVEQLKNIPNLGGEPDVIKAFQMMPGVQGGKEGTSGLYVRGGTPDQNLFLLDNVPLYYVSHVGGFISTFDPNAINDIKLYKGGFPAQYAGRLSSVIDIRMKDGNTNARKGEFSIGLLTTKFQMDGPFKKDSSFTYFISARRFNMDLITRPLGNIVNQFQGTAGYTFYDINGKLTKRFLDGSKLSLTIYEGRDNFFYNVRRNRGNGDVVGYNFKSQVKWGNFMTTINYTKPINPKLFANLSLSSTNFKFLTDVNARYSNPGEDELNNQSRIKFTSGINDIIFNSSFDYQATGDFMMRFGTTNTYHFFTPGRIDYVTTNAQDTVVGAKKIQAFENNVFVENHLKIGNRFFINAGLNFTSFVLKDTTFLSLQPRITASAHVHENITIQGGYSRMNQNLHYLTNSGAGLPSDLWIPVSRRLIPETSNQYNIGLTYTLRNRKFPLNFVLEGFYKDMNNLIEYKEGSNLFQGDELENKIINGGTGTMYGIEFLVQKTVGRLTGWFGYTWSKNTRQFDEINNGEPFPFVFDRRHDISLVVSYAIKEHIQFTATWVFATGNAITIAQGQYNVGDINPVIIDPNSAIIPEYYLFNNAHLYNGKNSSRLPAFHKLDIGFNFKKEKKRGERTWFVGVYNLYNRQNPFFMFYQKNDQGVNTLHQLTLFPIIPSFSYSFVFDKGKRLSN